MRVYDLDFDRVVPSLCKTINISSVSRLRLSRKPPPVGRNWMGDLYVINVKNIYVLCKWGRILRVLKQDITSVKVKNQGSRTVNLVEVHCYSDKTLLKSINLRIHNKDKWISTFDILVQQTGGVWTVCFPSLHPWTSSTENKICFLFFLPYLFSVQVPLRFYISQSTVNKELIAGQDETLPPRYTQK